MEIFDVYLPAGSDVLVPREGRFFRIIEGVGQFNVSTDTGVNSLIFPGIGVDLSEPGTGAAFRDLRLRAVDTQAVLVAVSYHPITDDRLQGVISAKAVARASLIGLPKITQAAPGAVQVAANVQRGRLDIQAAPENTGAVWVGGTAAGVGQRLDGGDTYQVDVTGAIDLYFEAAGEVYLAEVV